MLIFLAHNKIVYLVHVGFIHILLPLFLTDGLFNVILLNVGCLCVHIGTLNAHVGDDFWHLWFREGCPCLGHDYWLTAIAVCFPNTAPAPSLYWLTCTRLLVQD